MKRKILAQIPAPPPPGEPGEKIINPALSEKIQELAGLEFINLFLPNLITIFFIVATIATLFVLLIGGIKWITSAGDKAATESARSTITAAIIGLVFTFCVYAILRLLEFFFGIDLIIIDIGPLILGE